ncbi:MAG: carboxypeptidase-like regulatory domain-containing protein [Bryobacteraceae bacterium]
MTKSGCSPAISARGRFVAGGRWLAVLTAAAMLCAPLGLAQSYKDTYGKKKDDHMRSVQGVVTGPDEKLVSGAVVQLKNTKTLQIRSFITQENGSYYFHELSTDVDYELKADFRGASSSNKTLSSFDTRKQAILDLKLNKK